LAPQAQKTLIVSFYSTLVRFFARKQYTPLKGRRILIWFILLLIAIVLTFSFLVKKRNGIKNRSKDTISEPICPHCAIVLKSEPRRKSKCPACGKYIYVRSKQNLFSSHLLTREDAICVDTFKNLAGFGTDESDFFTTKSELSKRFGKAASSTDTIWQLYNNIIAKAKHIGQVHTVYYQMALFRNRLGKPYFNLLQEAIKAELKNMNIRIIELVKIKNAGNSCPACQQLDGKILSIDQALKTMPIPCESCTYELEGGPPGFCRCYYEPQINS
jgi:predicted RNA-binding Zn-ribbon protein involved in translation (DUF1610 family)